jgi:hypothetical protein
MRRQGVRQLLGRARPGPLQAARDRAPPDPRFLTACAAADMPQTTRLATTVEKWWPEIEGFLELGVTPGLRCNPRHQADQEGRLRLPQPGELREAHHVAQRDPPGRVNTSSAAGDPLKRE